MWVSQHLSILSTRIDIFAMGQHIWLGAQPSCMVADQVVESRKILQPMDLAMGELLGEIYREWKIAYTRYMCVVLFMYPHRL